MSDDLRLSARRTLDRLRSELLAERHPDGHWVGQLSASALSTATAVSAISTVLLNGERRDDKESCERASAVREGIDYLNTSQNADGGFGDTDRSHSNIATSYLVLAASTLAQSAIATGLGSPRTDALKSYIRSAGELDGLRKRYGKDKTFVVPIMANMAIAGLISWEEVAALPFEAAIVPQSLYRLVRMPVVSYAIPALVAIGQARHYCGQRTFLPLRLLRAASVGPAMRVLQRMQPDSGGYLEATPLTSFVVMSLAASGRVAHEVSRNGLRFLIESMHPDGSWPIDTNLATWVTSLSIDALAADPEDDGKWCSESLVRWHLSCQHRRRHPFTGAEPGGWGWSDLSGAVPDGDDTPGAILALAACRRYSSAATSKEINLAIAAGKRWLLRLQNRDGGWPTFCRGWGKLPFDRSSTDLTAHSISALRSKTPNPAKGEVAKIDRHEGAVKRGIRFLSKNQEPDGSWLPLWFGNQDRHDEDNPIYGTAKVMIALARLSRSGARPSDAKMQAGSLHDALNRSVAYLLEYQNKDGGWGGGQSVTEYFYAGQSSGDCPQSSTIEETALAVEALATYQQTSSRSASPRSASPRSASPRSASPRSASSRSAAWRKPAGIPAGESPNSIEQASNGETEIFGNVTMDPSEVTPGGKTPCELAIIAGIRFLIDGIEKDQHKTAWPIGFYFAKLWYYERLYPLIFCTKALGTFLRTDEQENEILDTDTKSGSIVVPDSRHQ